MFRRSPARNEFPSRNRMSPFSTAAEPRPGSEPPPSKNSQPRRPSANKRLTSITSPRTLAADADLLEALTGSCRPGCGCPGLVGVVPGAPAAGVNPLGSPARPREVGMNDGSAPDEPTPDAPAGSAAAPVIGTA